MSGGDHLVIDEFFRGAHVTVQAGVAADGHIAQIDHAEFRLLLGRLILPILDRVRPQPARSRTVTTLATHAVVQVKSLGALLGWNRERVTGQAFLVLLRWRLQIQDAADAQRDVIGKHLIGARMFVLSGPDAVLVLRNVGDLFGLNAAVATAGSAASGAVVFSDRRSLAGGGSGERETNPNAGYASEISAAGCGESGRSALHY